MKKKEKRSLKWAVAALLLLSAAALALFLAPDLLPGRWPFRHTIQVSGSTVTVNDSLRLNTFTAEDFAVDERGRMTCQSSSFRTGVDVSRFQGTIDWKKASADGISFALVRAGSRSFSTGELRRDDKFAENVKGAASAGIDVGVYFFSQAVSPEEAEEEAEFLLKEMEGLPITLGVAYDWERVDSDLDEENVSRTNDVDNAIITACALSFLQRIEAGGYQGILYCNGETGYFVYDIAQLQGYPVWYASFSAGWPNYYYGVDLWQYSDGGSVEGIGGYVDLNLMWEGSAVGDKSLLPGSDSAPSGG